MADEIDPRYAAQFQRGFDPARHGVPAPRRGPLRLAGGPVPTAERVPDPPSIARAPESVAAGGADTPESDAPEPGSLEAGEPLAPTRLTWWDWLLPGIGACLIVVSLSLWWGLATDSSAYFGTGGSDRWTMLVQYARHVLAGPVLIAGVLAVTAGLVLQAMRPRR